MERELQRRLRQVCSAAYPDRAAVEIENAADITSGWESEMFTYDLVYGPAGARWREAQVLRLYPGERAADTAEREFKGMQQLHRSGYPVPAVYVLERDRAPLGKPFVIMERVAGEPMMEVWPRAPQDKQGEMLLLFCRLLVQLHRLDWRPFVDCGEPNPDPYAHVDAELAGRRARMARWSVAGFEPVLEWLEARRDRVPCARPAPVHWDYYPDNILVREDGGATVVDWTQVGVSDPRFDLGWTLMLVASHVSPALCDMILQGYQRMLGEDVAELDFFIVFACVKRLYGVVVSRVYGSETLGMRPEAVAIMNGLMGVFEKVYAMLLERTSIPIPEVEAMYV